MIMDAQKQPSRRQRPEAQPYSPEDLRKLARDLIAAAGTVAEVADALENAAKDAIVRINYTQAVETGLTSVKLLVGDVEKKITQKKFHYPGTGVVLPSDPHRVPLNKPTKLPTKKRTK